MSDEGTITLKNGISLEIKEWLKRRYNIENKTENTTEYGRRCKDEIINLKKSIKKRTVKKIISPEYEPKFSEVRYLTDEEIVKEYIMVAVDQKDKGKSKAYRILALMKELGGRAVLTSVIASGIKGNKRNVSSILSQLQSAGLIDSTRSPSNKKIFLWKRNPEAICYSLEQMVTIYNDHIRSVRKRSRKGQIIPPTKDQEQREEWKKHAGREYYYKEQGEEWKKRNRKIIVQEEKEEKPVDGISFMTKEEIAGLQERIKKLIEKQQEENIKKEESKLSTPLPKTIRVIVEGSIKILIGLDK